MVRFLEVSFRLHLLALIVLLLNAAGVSASQFIKVRFADGCLSIPSGYQVKVANDVDFLCERIVPSTKELEGKAQIVYYLGEYPSFTPPSEAKKSFGYFGQTLLTWYEWETKETSTTKYHLEACLCVGNCTPPCQNSKPSDPKSCNCKCPSCTVEHLIVEGCDYYQVCLLKESLRSFSSNSDNCYNTFRVSVVKAVQPVCPPAAKSMGLKGRAIVQVEIDKEGNVETAKLVMSSNPIFNEPALTAARQWKFQSSAEDNNSVGDRQSTEQITFDCN